MHEVLPEPSNKTGRVLSNNNDYISIYITKASREDYNKYVEECKGKGLTVDSEKNTNNFEAYNSEGYELRIYYSEFSKEYNISLNAPMKLKENAWVSTPLSQLIPEPDSKLGKVELNSEKSFTYYAGKTSQDVFSSYANSVLNAGFNKDFSSTDTYFYGKNDAGYKVTLNYEGNNIMKISITAPDDKTKTETTPTPAPTPTPTPTPTATPTEEPTPETPAPSENKSSSNGIRPDFKKAMDDYESFMNEYVDFMKKYNSNPSDLSLLADYTSYLSKYSKVVDSFDKLESEDMNEAEMKYYLEVQTRVNKKLLEVE